jgi:hypothetical protein
MFPSFFEESMDQSEVEERQIRNIRNKVRDIVNKATAEIIIKLAVILNVQIPENLKGKYQIKE